MPVVPSDAYRSTSLLGCGLRLGAQAAAENAAFRSKKRRTP